MDSGSSRRRKVRQNVGTSTSGSSRLFFLNNFFKIALVLLIGLVVLVPVLFIWYSRDLPPPGQLIVSKYKDATRIYDRNGVLLYSVYQGENRTFVKLDDMPKYLREGTISIEDKDFYKNQGFSPIGYLRVAKNFFLGHGLAGASTISQQLVKNVLLSNQRTLSRKIKELILSIQVNKTYTKDQILETYLNNISYGGVAIGVEAAAETYFGKDVKDLDLAQAAFLSGLPQSPTLYSPFNGNKYYVDRTAAVLRRMSEDGYITSDQQKQALAEISGYKFSQHGADIKAPHFVMYVKQQLANQFGAQAVETGGFQVTTTLDYDIQKKAEEIVKSEIADLKTYHVSNGAAIVRDPKTGEILAMVGSKDYFDDENDGNFNVAVSNNRQPGSSLKPVLYAAAFEKGYTPATMVMDVKTNFKPTTADDDYLPVNYDGKFHGPVQLRYALANSLNIPAVKMNARVGIDAFMKKAYDMGISNWEPTKENKAQVGLSLVLGGRGASLLDETTAYGVFANKGVRQDPVSILKVADTKGNVIFENKKTDGKKVLSEEIAFLISHILSDPAARAMEFGTHSWLDISGHTVSVKTGTTDDKRDNWTVGYTSSYVVGVWVGNNDNSPMNKAISSGITGASPIWNKLMTAVLKGKPDESLTKPDNVVALQVDALAGGLPHGGQPNRAEYFIKGTEPTSESPIYKSKDGKEYFVFKEDDPVSTDGTNRWQQGIDDWINQEHKDDEKWHPPAELTNTTPTPTPTPGGSVNGAATTPTPTETPSPTSDTEGDTQRR